MPQIALLLIGVLTFFQESISKSLKDKNTKNIVIAIVLFLAYRYFKGLENAKNWAKQPIGALVSRLKIAFHPYVDTSFSLGPFNFSLPDGTNEEEVKAVAFEVGQKFSLSEFQDAYKSLTGRDLTEQLDSEGVADIFNASLQLGKANKGGVMKSGSLITNVIRAGSIVEKKTGGNIRTLAGKSVNSLFTVSEQFKVVRIEKGITVAGTTGVWVVVIPYSFITIDSLQYEYYIALSQIIKVR